jgi:hypothetical protein
MTNHFHLLIQTPEANLSRGMHWFNTVYVVWFNRRHQRSGHLYQGRFKALLIDKETYFMEVLRYVVLNPVRAGMVERPDDYLWSSYRATAGLEPSPDWLDVANTLGSFAPDREIAETYYREFVAQKAGSKEGLWEQLVHGIFLGGEQWIKNMRKFIDSKPRSTDHPTTQRCAGRPKMDAVITAVAKSTGQTGAAIRAKRGGSWRRLAAWIGWFEGWQTLRSIAAALRLRSEGHVSGLIKRAESECGSDPQLLMVLDGALALLNT